MPEFFADLFAAPGGSPQPPAAAAQPKEPRIFSVSDITHAVREVIDGAFGEVWVEGEVSNFRQQASGHQYFTLKDAGSQLACVLFARPGAWRRTTAAIRDGMLVQARGRLTVYEARGQYQLNVSAIQPAGAGLLQAKFEALKRKLDGEGLFDPERKRRLPQFPRMLGIVTSPTGAALRDMLNILERRAPWLPVVVSPARVQGEGAAAEIIAALANLAAMPAPPDVIVLARGGGSMEDLWEFNDETLARAIAACRIPVVSAVGHEIDFTMSDFVADLRAPTPSAAAELVAPDTAALLRQIGESAARMSRTAANAFAFANSELASLAASRLFREPVVRIEQLTQRLDSAAQELDFAVRDSLGQKSRTAAELESRLLRHRPDQVISLREQQIGALAAGLRERAAARLSRLSGETERLEAMLRLLSPEATLRRGYSITTGGDGHVFKSATEAANAERLVTRFADGTVESRPEKPRKPRKPKVR